MRWLATLVLLAFFAGVLMLPLGCESSAEKAQRHEEQRAAAEAYAERAGARVVSCMPYDNIVCDISSGSYVQRIRCIRWGCFLID